MVLTARQQRRLVFSLLFVSILGNARAAEPQEFPLPPYVDAICIPVKLGGKERIFVLDSGASTVFIDVSLKEHLGQPNGRHQTGIADGRRMTMEFFESPAMRVGKSGWKCSETIGCFDFSPLQTAIGKNIEGVLGLPFFATHIVQLDFDRQLVRVLPPDTPPADDWGTAISLTGDEHDRPLMPLEFPGVGTELCMIDTGFNGSLSLNWATCLALENKGKYSLGPDRLIMTPSAKLWMRSGVVSKVRLGSFEHSDLEADCSKVGNSVGLGYLKRFRVTIDLAHQTAYFAKGIAFDEREERRIGFRVTRGGERTLIIGVQRGYPGEQAGLRENDELISVGGKPVRGMSTNEIDWTIRQLSRKGTKPVGLTIRRNGKVRDLQLDLSPIYK